MERSNEPKRIECHHCGYIWYTRSALMQVSCPNCGGKTYIEAKEELVI